MVKVARAPRPYPSPLTPKLTITALTAATTAATDQEPEQVPPGWLQRYRAPRSCSFMRPSRA